MIYLICQTWTNTSNNHAGIKYLCNRLQEMYPDLYYCYCIPDYYVQINRNFLLRKLQYAFVQMKYHGKMKSIIKDIQIRMSSCDKVFLMEYMELLYPQLYMAKQIKRLFPDIPVYAMIHLVPAILERNFNNKSFFYWMNSVDKIFTLGTSLTTYLVKRGYDSSKIVTTFHYADIEYYQRPYNDGKFLLKIIAMGNQMRNISLLRSIVESNREALFVICQGVSDMSSYFCGMDNVLLIPYVAEHELKNYMSMCDVSLNIMYDTIGSNVIVTSMSMGLAMICSDVGSIHDYCDDSNCIFCNNEELESFATAVKTLTCNHQRVELMKMASRAKAEQLSIENFSNQIQKLEKVSLNI